MPLFGGRSGGTGGFVRSCCAVCRGVCTDGQILVCTSSISDHLGDTIAPEKRPFVPPCDCDKDVAFLLTLRERWLQSPPPSCDVLSRQLMITYLVIIRQWNRLVGARVKICEERGRDG